MSRRLGSEARFWRDGWFWAALLAGPVAWAGLRVVGVGNPGAGLAAPRVWLMVVVVAPILEELAFRGALQGWLLDYRHWQRRLGPVTCANLVTALVFAAFHLLSQPLAWAAMIVVPGLVFGWARDRYGGVLPCMVLHAFYNAGFVALFVSG